MAKEPIDSGEVTFQSEGRLLQELGERLVASSEVAIVELIKNAYDADATICHVLIDDDNNSLIIEDDGFGITLDEFKQKWMRIASGFKEKEQFSRTFKRKLTGAKGIGRFAVRFLGNHLTLESIALDNEKKQKTRLEAFFNWLDFDKTTDLNQVKVPYRLYSAPNDANAGTKLRISKLNGEFASIFSSQIRTEVLRIVNPLSGLERAWFAREKDTSDEDPGFRVLLPVQKDGGLIDENLAENILNNYWARLTISLKRKKLQYKIFSEDDKEKAIFEHNQQYENSITNGAFADIRFFPRRQGIFSHKGINGTEAWKWIKNNFGVAVVDHGFRIKPYGYAEDDWLKLSADSAINRRNWRSRIAKEFFPIPDQIRMKPSLNPMLYLPSNHQLVGAVFVESGHRGIEERSDDLTPSMDREGYLENKAFNDLTEIVRAGLEMVALVDKREEERRAEEKARLVYQSAREDVREAIKIIKDSPTLTKIDKERLIAEYGRLARNIEEMDEYHRHAQQGLETMSLLGVVAGFMTHENKRILHDLDQLRRKLLKLSNKYKELREPLEDLEQRFSEFKSHIEYTTMFIKSVHSRAESSFNARAQIELVVEKFEIFTNERSIEVAIEVDEDLKTPVIPIALYSGILLNLFTNALKAVTAGPTSNKHPTIAFKGWNEKRKHIVEVLDNGIGIPPSLEKRIWDPLFTTTSNENNPLGSGMGLGLSIVKKLVRDIGGSIYLVKAPTGFSTCFRVELPQGN